MKIAHLTPTFFSESSIIGGGERYVYNIAKSIQIAADSRDKVIDQSIISLGEKAKHFERDEIQVHILKNDSPFPEKMNAIPTQLRSLLDSIEKLDLVHIHQSLTLFGAYATAIAKSKGVCIISTDLGGGENDFMLHGKGLELCDGVLSISQYAKSLISSNFSGMHCTQIGPVDTERFTTRPKTSRKKDTALCVGRLLPHKGLDLAIKALPKQMKLLIVGRPYDLKYFEFLKSLSKDKNVEFITNANDNDLIRLYRTSTILIQASVHKDCYGNTYQKPELMGLTTLEALSCGLPVVTSTAGSLPELVPDARFGRTFSSLEELKAIFREITDNKWPKQEASELARKHVIQNHSFLSTGNAVLNFYKSTLEQQKTRGHDLL